MREILFPHHVQPLRVFGGINDLFGQTERFRAPFRKHDHFRLGDVLEYDLSGYIRQKFVLVSFPFQELHRTVRYVAAARFQQFFHVLPNARIGRVAE